MAVISTSSIAHDGYVIEGYESALPSTAASGNIVGQSMYTRVTLSDASGATIGNTANWAHAYGYMAQAAGVSDAASYYLQDEAGNLYRLEAIYAGGGTYVNAETGHAAGVTSVHTRALVLRPVDDQGVDIVGANTLTTYVPAGAYNNASYIDSDPVDSIDITSMGVVTNTGNIKTTNPTGAPLIICFTKGTEISIGSGVARIEDLRVGDLVQTHRNGLQPIRWIGERKLCAAVLKRYPKLRPIHISAGALGQDLPEKDLRVSRQHCMLLSSELVHHLSGNGDVLVSAIKLTEHPGISIDMSIERVVYFHILFDDHQIIYANGAPSESLYTGPHALKTLTPAAYGEVIALFPEIETAEYTPTAACFIPNNKEQKNIVRRHIGEQQTMMGHSPR